MNKRDNYWVLSEKSLERSLLRVSAIVIAAVFALLTLGHFIGAVATPLVFILFALILVMGLNPLVVRLETQLKLPRKAAAPLVVLGILAFLIGFVAVVVPMFVSQATRFAQTLPELWSKLQANLEVWATHNAFLKTLLQSNGSLDLGKMNLDGFLKADGLMAHALGIASNAASLLAYAVLLFVLVMFLLLQPEPLIKGVLSGIHPRQRATVERTLVRIGSQLGNWLIGSMLLSLFVGVLVGAGLALMGFQNAFLFGMIAGVTNIIPFVGAWLGISLPILVALSSGAWGLAIGAAILVLVIRQLDDYFLSPAIYGRTVQLHPASLLIGVLIFGSWLGFVGVFLAVPLSIIVKALYEEVYLASLNRPEVTNESIAQVMSAGYGEEAVKLTQDRLDNETPSEAKPESAPETPNQPPKSGLMAG